MSNNTKKPVNITINESEKKESNDIYENYIIQMNQNLKDENDKLKEEIKELTSTNNDLEEDLSKEEKSKTYMKGLMHNLYDMKNKSIEMNSLNKKINQKYDDFMKSEINKPLKIYFVPNTSLYLNINEYFIFSFLIAPILSLFSSIIDYNVFLMLIFLSIYPGTILFLFIKNDVNNNNIKLNELIEWKKNIIKDLNKIQNEINETDNSCRCLDTYIDEL